MILMYDKGYFIHFFSKNTEKGSSLVSCIFLYLASCAKCVVVGTSFYLEEL